MKQKTWIYGYREQLSREKKNKTTKTKLVSRYLFGMRKSEF